MKKGGYRAPTLTRQSGLLPAISIPVRGSYYKPQSEG